ncbi:hypothetical protein [Spirosoma radiotolerans]|uniref:Uncharacterized protein n=1 Tax=Spirosoma radiotolerans TaxID=1379870 RepID=A0A0E3ZU42_9BACT|nr:hypothetical protein [Spirosoma radiotolerans]AKD54215.1 hypothetical protein SD10_04150 [Spirosoma radiotolerans]
MMKLISLISWALTSGWSACMVYALMNRSRYNDAGGRDQETALIGLGVFVLVVLIVLNLLPYSWAKICALVIGILLLLLVYYIQTH